MRLDLRIATTGSILTRISVAREKSPIEKAAVVGADRGECTGIWLIVI